MSELRGEKTQVTSTPPLSRSSLEPGIEDLTAPPTPENSSSASYHSTTPQARSPSTQPTELSSQEKLTLPGQDPSNNGEDETILDPTDLHVRPSPRRPNTSVAAQSTCGGLGCAKPLQLSMLPGSKDAPSGNAGSKVGGEEEPRRRREMEDAEEAEFWRQGCETIRAHIRVMFMEIDRRDATKAAAIVREGSVDDERRGATGASEPRVGLLRRTWTSMSRRERRR